MTIFHNFYLVQACSHGGGRGAACDDGWRDLWQARQGDEQYTFLIISKFQIYFEYVEYLYLGGHIRS